MNIGPIEIAVVLILALLLFGPKRLPQAGRSLGQAMRELRKATQAAKTDLGLDQVEADVKDLKSSLGVDEVAADMRDLKSSLTIDLKASDKPPASATAGANGPENKAARPPHSASEATPAEPPEAPAQDGVPSDATKSAAGAVPPAPANAAPRRRFRRTAPEHAASDGGTAVSTPPRRRFARTAPQATGESSEDRDATAVATSAAATTAPRRAFRRHDIHPE